MKDPHPDKGRALGRLEEKQGRTIRKEGRKEEGRKDQAGE